MNYTQSWKIFELGLHNNGSNNFLFVNATKICQFKAKDSQIKDYALCLGNISKYFATNNMKIETKRKRNIFFCWFNPIDTNDVLYVHRCFMKGSYYKCLQLFKKMFTVLLNNIVNGSNHTKCVSLSNQKYMTEPTFVNLHQNGCSQTSHNYSFVAKLDWCVGSCNTINDLSNKVCVPNKTEDLDSSVMNVIKGKNESKTLTKYMLCKCKCKFNERKCDSNQWWNNDKCWFKCKNHHVCEKDFIWIPATCNCGNGKHLPSVIDD